MTLMVVWTLIMVMNWQLVQGLKIKTGGQGWTRQNMRRRSTSGLQGATHVAVPQGAASDTPMRATTRNIFNNTRVAFQGPFSYVAI